MRIVFGWNLDRAPWTTDDTGTTVVTGPLGMLGILQTRLGTTRPTVDRSIRIAQYRALLERAGHPWFRQSFLNDPWHTAEHLLALRDDAIEAGWDPNLDDVDYSAHPRLDALSKVEELVVLEPSHDTDATLVPGRADDLRETRNTPASRRRVATGHLVARAPRSARSASRVWQDIINAAESAGIAVTESVTNSSIPDLAIVRGTDEWSTAEAAARYLAHLPNRDRLCIIAGDSTSVLTTSWHDERHRLSAFPARPRLHRLLRFSQYSSGQCCSRPTYVGSRISSVFHLAPMAETHPRRS